MSDPWSEWDAADASPYIDWWSRLGRFGNPEEPPDPEAIGAQIARTFLDPEQSPLVNDGSRAKEHQPYDTFVPIPNFAKNSGFEDHISAGGGWLPDLQQLPEISDDTIIVGVVDTGIPLGHNRFRNADGSSRILAAWQTLAPWDGPGGLAQDYIPFGRELYKHEIDSMLDQFSDGDLHGWLDEHGFNTATGVVDMKHLLGHREAAGIYSHGAHVLDAAAGVDPNEPGEDRDILERVRIIAVNIPSSSTFGASGTFLDQYMFYAIQRISDLADAIWLKNHPNHEPGARRGYPVVMNVSFGKQAGSKSTVDRFPLSLREFKCYRKQADLEKVYFVMPAGNDNLDRCNAYLEPHGGETKTLDWRILPEDHSSNYVEVWTTGNFAGANPVEIAVVPPDGAETSFPTSMGVDGQVRVLGDQQAGIYCQFMDDPNVADFRKFRYVICIAPTVRTEAVGDPAPAGIWKIKLKNITNDQIQCVLSVQTDQKILPGGRINLRSYFDDEGYRRFDYDGRLIESYSYPDEPAVNIDVQADTPVRRHGTMNSSGAHKHVARVGGYRSSDGKQTVYSSTGRGPARASIRDDGTDLGASRAGGRALAPTASLPTDDGPAHFGILSAGAANGSVKAMQGTSFASSQATRVVVKSLLDRPGSGKSENARLFHAATAAESVDMGRRTMGTVPYHAGPYQNELIEGLGGGRIPTPLKPKVSRTGR